jgi:hypothetical protein
MALACGRTKADTARKFIARAKRVHDICFGGGDGVFERMYGAIIGIFQARPVEQLEAAQS